MLTQNKMIKTMFMIFAAVGIIFIVLGVVLGIAVTPALFAVCAFGLIFAAIGLIPLLLSSKKQKANEALRESGFRVDAVITQVQINNAVTVNGQNPYNIICEGKDAAGIPRVYKSENVYAFVPTTAVGQPITIFASRENPDQYLVDVSAFTGV